MSKPLSEWRFFWYLPLVGALGYATSTIYVYSLGPFIAPIQESFEWSRAQVSSGITIASFLTALFSIPLGILVDKIGPRRVGVTGATLMCLAFGSLGFATGGTMNWIIHWVAIALATVGVQTTVWTSAVNSRFVANRGVALAITLSGAAVAVTIYPIMATYLIEQFGWRKGFMYLGLFWGLLVVPLLALFFRGKQDEIRTQVADSQTPQDVLKGLTMRQGFRSAPMWKLVLASSFFSFTAVSLVVHYVPILTDNGVEAMNAAGIASIIGIFSIIGRLGTGFLLDHFKAYNIGALSFLLPIIGCTLLLLDGTNPTYQMIAAAVFGLTLGSEVDVISYLGAQYFGMRNFGALFGTLVMALSMGTAFGPLSAGAVYDAFGSYEPFLKGTVLLMAISSITLYTLRRNKTADEIDP